MESIECFEIKIIEFAKYDRILSQPKDIYFDTADDLHISIREGTFYCVCVDEEGNRNTPNGIELRREIRITSKASVSSRELFITFQNLEKLLMVFYGNFLNIQSIEFYDEKGEKCTDSDQIEKFYISHRLKYYESKDIFQKSRGVLCEFDSILSNKIFTRWKRLLNKLEIVHQIVFYSTADTGLPIEIALAFIIEAFEPLYEYLAGIDTKSFPLKKCKNAAKDNGFSLREKLEKIIDVYGKDVFENELSDSDNKARFLDLLRNSRVRIMHVKRKYEDPFLDGKDAIAYIGKLLLLYRHILLCRVGIDYLCYKQKLIDSVRYYDQLKT